MTQKKAGKLFSCLVDFNKAFDTVPCAVLWQVLEHIGIHGPVLDCIKSLYAHDSAAVPSYEGISAIFECFMAMLFGLYVDGLEQHLKNTVGHDSPSLSGTFILLLLYGDDLIIMSTTPSCLQRQSHVLQRFCSHRQLSVNFTKTKVIIFEHTESSCQDFIFNADVVERVQTYKYLGFEFHATKSLAHQSQNLLKKRTRQCMQ